MRISQKRGRKKPYQGRDYRLDYIYEDATVISYVVANAKYNKFCRDNADKLLLDGLLTELENNKKNNKKG